MKIYTRTGDSGQAALYSGQRLYKDHDVFQALGDVDELNSAIGVAMEFSRDISLTVTEQLEAIQSRLLDVGSAVATPIPSSTDAKLNRTHFPGVVHATIVEGWIDEMDRDLPELKNFILPSGGKAAAFLHHARSVCRRAERSVVVLTRQQQVSEEVLMYLNRLSDYLFTAARFMAHTEGKPEVVYKKS